MDKELTSKERVRLALLHQQTDRTPFSWGFCCTSEMNKVLEKYFSAQNINWEKLKSEVSDKYSIEPKHLVSLPAGSDALAIWGIKRKNVSYGSGEYAEFIDFPLAGIETPNQLDTYPWPDPNDYDFQAMRQNFLTNHPKQDKAVQYSAGNPFEIYCWMTGLEEALVNMLINPEVVKAGLRHITDFFRIKLEKVLEHAGDLIDIVFFADDLGSQTGLLISKECYIDTLQPFHRELTDTVKKLSPHTFTMLHSDGAVFDLLPEIIASGFDVFEAVQTDAKGMAPERLKETFGDRLSFHGGISVQQLLPNCDAETVRTECRRLIHIFGKNGGYIAAPSHAIQMGTPPENVQAMLQGVFGNDLYQKFCHQAICPR